MPVSGPQGKKVFDRRLLTPSVNFSADQNRKIKELVARGKLEDAQMIILDELAVQFGDG